MPVTRREFSKFGIKAAAVGAGVGLLQLPNSRSWAHSPAGAAASGDASGHPMSVKFRDVKWQKIVPDMGDDSPTISILRVDPKTQAAQLLIWAPKNFHVPRHWHSANEAHTLVRGTMIFECDGSRDELSQGSFNYIPAKMVHQAWTKPEEEALLFITVDAAWDINWVDGPPQAAKVK